ncbi:HD domain-containing protein, partial [Candidatus Nitrosopelagicus sp.]|nr:HD domain-containing protein [Candidatus Nitrosopelagicus sp.]
MKNQFLEITDPIHDFIRLNSTEQKIIDTPVFQRLRRIKQLSGAHLTYPGAQHTRFEHSLGVMHIAGMASNSLSSKKQMHVSDTDDIRLAALLHDIGHGPFSHLFEEVLQKKKRITHEQIGKQIILKSEIGDIISKTTDKKKINRLAVGEGTKQFENEIISGALSADMMDYLLRDGYFTGAEHAKIDHNRITNSFEVYKNKLALQSSALVNFETMMISRFQMFKAVYFHKTVRAGEVMLLEAMSLADDHLGLSEMNVQQYVTQTDDSILLQLTSLPETNSDLKAAKKIANDYQNRKLFKCVYEKTISGKKSFTNNTLKQFREDIAKKSKLDKSQVFIDTSTTHSMPLAPSKKESNSIILI